MAWALDNTLWPLVFKMLIDKVSSIPEVHKSDGLRILAPTLLVGLVLWIVIETMSRVQGVISAKFFPRFEADIRIFMFRYVHSHSYSYFTTNYAGEISSIINDMTRSVSYIVQKTITVFIPAVAAFIIAMIMFYRISSIFTLIVCFWVVVHSVICVFLSKKCITTAHRHSASRSFLTGKIVDIFSNFLSVKIFGGESHECNNINHYQNDELSKHITSLLSVEKIKIILSIPILIFPVSLSTFYLIYSWQYNLITIGDFVLILNTNWNIMLIAWIGGLELPNLFREIGVCIHALNIIIIKHEVIDTESAIPLNVKSGCIEFKNVSFGYQKEKQIFKKLQITIKGGSKVGLVGFSGSGKSTFIKLIMKFYNISSGQIFIDGQDIGNSTIESVRRQISFIPQDIKLFNDTLEYNIQYGKIGANNQELIKASKKALCHNFIKELKYGYNTVVGENGIKLSGGQRQRIAIARAMLKDASILILDEATSALDSITEDLIQRSLKDWMKNRTTIVISHRLSNLSKVDRILVFSGGEIIEEGSHKELLAIKNGHYRKMWSMQVQGFLPEHKNT